MLKGCTTVTRADSPIFSLGGVSFGVLEVVAAVAAFRIPDDGVDCQVVADKPQQLELELCADYEVRHR